MILALMSFAPAVCHVISALLLMGFGLGEQEHARIRAGAGDAGGWLSERRRRAAEPGRTRIGWIGLGVMGASMCGHLRDAGYAVAATTRTRAKAEPLLARGVAWAATRRARSRSRATWSSCMVGFPRDVREVVHGERGALAGLRAGGVLRRHDDERAALAQELAEAARARGAFALDAPVSGGDVGAREARLSIMVGGDAAAVAAVHAVLRAPRPDDRPPGRPGRGPAREARQPDA